MRGQDKTVLATSASHYSYVRTKIGKKRRLSTSLGVLPARAEEAKLRWKAGVLVRNAQATPKLNYYQPLRRHNSPPRRLQLQSTHESKEDWQSLRRRSTYLVMHYRICTTPTDRQLD